MSIEVIVLMLVVSASILVLISRDRKIAKEQIEEINKEQGITEMNLKPQKDKIAVWSFVLGLSSIPFAFIGLIPLLATILGIIGINRTKIKGSGRWMAITGLVLGIIYFISNMYMNGHLG